MLNTLSEKTRKQELPIVVCVDRFYMSEKAIKTLQKQGKIIWADCENEDGLIREVQNVNPKVIISEYFKISGRVMDASPNLKGIVVWGVGYDHIDVEAADENTMICLYQYYDLPSSTAKTKCS